MSSIRLTGASTPSNPSSGTFLVYMKPDGLLYTLNSSGTETAIGSTGTTAYPTPYVVSLDGDTDYSTIQSAIDAAATEAASSSRHQVVIVRPGAYTEDLTFKDKVVVVGSNSLVPMVDSTVASSPIITGDADFDAGATSVHVQGLTFIGATAGTPTFEFSTTTGGCSLFMVQCVINATATMTANMVDLVNGTAGSFAQFEDCTFNARSSSSYGIYVDGANLTTRFSRCRMTNTLEPQNLINLTADSGTSSDMYLSYCDLRGGMSVEDAGCDLFLQFCDVIESTSSNALIRLGNATATATAAFTRFEGGATSNFIVSGTGAYSDEGACSYDKSTPFQSTLASVTFPSQIDYRSVAQGVLEISSTPVTLTEPYTMLLVDTATIGAGSSIDLPDAADFPGHRVTVYDEGGSASSNNITLSSTSSGISGGNVITTDSLSVTYQSTGTEWRRIATS